MAEPMALATPPSAGLATLRAPESFSGRMMEPPPTRITSTSPADTFMASRASSARVVMAARALRAKPSSRPMTFSRSPSSVMPSRTAMSVAVQTAPPKHRASSVIR